MKLNLWTLKFELHVIFMSPNIIPLLILFQPFKIFKSILVHGQRQAMGQVWPVGYNLPSPTKLRKRDTKLYLQHDLL